MTSGNFLEMFDFLLFGFYATDIAKTFFPSTSEFVSLMQTFAVFGAGFLMRPLGAIVLGAYIDRVGRRQGLLVTLSIMAAGTLLIACVPGFHSIGLWAPLLVLVGRLLQGFSAGVELGGVAVYLSEIAPPGRKGFYASWQSASQQVAVVCMALIGYGLNAWLAPAVLSDWGWRIPFFIGCLIVPFLFVMRRTLQETDAFLARTHHPGAREVFATLLADWRLVLAGMMLVVTTTVSFYLITVYAPTFGKTVLKLSASDALIVAFCVGVSNFMWLPLSGALSDRIGRWPILATITTTMLFTTYPSLAWLVTAPSLHRMLIVELWLSFLYASYNGAMIAALTEVMPANVRTSGFALAYSLSMNWQGDRAVRRLHALRFHVAHPHHSGQSLARHLDDLRRRQRSDRDMALVSAERRDRAGARRTCLSGMPLPTAQRRRPADAARSCA